ncbi:hypothetical protein [Saccharopolyspora rosea]|uniref:Uncharacterized protein n=1 Tax=Saccharopolyspora rosea TaxID=524884 RepID=A0ABW3G2N5_9PSEU|nr:hypothetical protein [Saccharopolyspora rosea]
MLVEHHCLVVACDVCGDRYESTEGVVWHFASVDEVRRKFDADVRDTLAGEIGLVWDLWSDGHVRCDQCRARARCSEQGHVWGEWSRCLCHITGAHRDEERPAPCRERTRYCRRCCDRDTTHDDKGPREAGEGW